ncbi:MAG: hypothetical protein Q8N53_12010 [Longimicrobiales bacterium]|nr:hypothetical protein [Longimicrobiales bacterium]
MASLTGKDRPRLCYLPTASADSPSGIIRWYENCAELNVSPFVQDLTKVECLGDNDAGMYFEEDQVRRVVATREGAKAYYVSVVAGQVVEKLLEPELIA